MPDRKTVVIVEDEWLLALDLLHWCEDLGARVLGLARNVPEAVSDLPPLQPDTLVTDMNLDDRGDGVDVACETRKHTPNLRVVFVTGRNGPGELARISATKPHRILSKPVSEAELRDALA